MTHAFQLPPSSPSPPPSRQNKVDLQRAYREKEVECFNRLKDVIKDLTGQEPRTRQDILRKAIDMLLAASEVRKQSGAHWRASTPSPNETPSPTIPPMDPISVPMDYASQSPHRPQSSSWQSDVEFNSMLDYSTHLHDQEYYLTSGMYSTLNQASSLEGEDWFNCHNLQYFLRDGWN